ncbi:MAG TPA: 3-hydroxyacyl-CoA dehydrogenase family protein [Stellaceae bacterium]|nr:3-hydroxyacyl-CoA dehydrogenase family protein [Stellaceae bacterium]
MIIDRGGSRSFPGPHAVREAAERAADIALLIGDDAGGALAQIPAPAAMHAIVVELGSECLGVHTGENAGSEGSNAVGFARFRLGDDPPSDLVELVRQPRTEEAAIAAATQLFTDAGLQVALCNDFAGRMIDRLVRPYYNDALRRLDEGLATAADLDLTLRLGLGYPVGPIALLQRSGLDHHFDVTQALYEYTGDPAYAPARRGRVAKERQRRNGGD